ncbi:MAG TPA: hypothetical protein VNB49_03960 [Candidatus Dormibacteraeota bacterium]|nr:hypothetical protein [Candidatus Dormibacteraeota bacterium]
MCFVELACPSRLCSMTLKGQTVEEFLPGFPTVSREAAVAALEEARQLLLASLCSMLIKECIDEWFRTRFTIMIAKRPAMPVWQDLGMVTFSTPRKLPNLMFFSP